MSMSLVLRVVSEMRFVVEPSGSGKRLTQLCVVERVPT